jgi:hypothetical protein
MDHESIRLSDGQLLVLICFERKSIVADKSEKRMLVCAQLTFILMVSNLALNLLQVNGTHEHHVWWLCLPDF